MVHSRERWGGGLESFQNMRVKYDLGKHEFFRYLQLRDYYRKEIKVDPSTQVNVVIQTIISIYKDTNIRMISVLYQKLTINKNTSNYIKEKWESEFNIEISDKDWLNMWKMHQTSTNLRIWREFSWKNLVRFFITPKVKSKYLSVNLS